VCSGFGDVVHRTVVVFQEEEEDNCQKGTNNRPLSNCAGHSSTSLPNPNIVTQIYAEFPEVICHHGKIVGGSRAA